MGRTCSDRPNSTGTASAWLAGASTVACSHAVSRADSASGVRGWKYCPATAASLPPSCSSTRLQNLQACVCYAVQLPIRGGLTWVCSRQRFPERPELGHLLWILLVHVGAQKHNHRYVPAPDLDQSGTLLTVRPCCNELCSRASAATSQTGAAFQTTRRQVVNPDSAPHPSAQLPPTCQEVSSLR